jgi:para-nitrobenzyl esterase
LSGGTIKGPGSDVFTLAEGEAAGVKVQQAVKARSLDDLRTYPPDRIIAAAQAAGIRTAPIVDTYFLPQKVGDIFAAGRQNEVSLVIGSTTNDGGTNVEVRRATTLAEYQAAAAKMFGPKAGDFLAAFPAASDADVKKSAEEAAMACGAGLSARTWAKAQTATGKSPVYLYRFSRVHSYAPGVVFADHDPKTAGAYHGGDMPYWLDTLDTFNMFRVTRNWQAYDHELADKMSNVVIAFAKTGDPSTSAVKMIRYDPANEQLVEFGDSIRVVKLNTKGVDFISENSALIPLGPPAGSPTPNR